MFELGLTPLVPVLILMLGAVIAKIAARFVPPRERDALALVMAGGAFVPTLLLACRPGAQVVVSPWYPPTLFGSQLAYITGGLAAPFALLVSLVCLAITISLSKWQWGTDNKGESPLYPAIFVVSAAGSSFVYSANLITLCFSWAFLDMSLLFLLIGQELKSAQQCRQVASGVRGRALLMSTLTGLGLVVAALLLDDHGLSLALAPSFLLLAALVRLGFYPVHFWMLAAAEIESPANTLLQTVSIATGFSLLARLPVFSPQGLPYQSQLVTIGSLTLLATALSAWAEQDRRRAISWIALNQVALAVLSVAVVGSQAKFFPLWSAFNLALCLSLLNLWPPEPARAGRYGLWLKVPTGLAIASLMGLPFTMGFVGRITLYRSLFALGQPYLWILSMVADVVLFAALFRIGADLVKCPILNAQFSLWVPHLASVIILAVPLVLLGIHPPLAGFIADMNLPATAELIGSADIVLWAALLLPLLGGYLLQRGQKAILEQSSAFWKGLAALLRLDWLHHWLWKVGWGIGAVLRGLARVIEGEGYLGWTLLLAFIAFLLLSNK